MDTLKTFSAPISILDTTTSSSISTGSLKLAGGLGISGPIFGTTITTSGLITANAGLSATIITASGLITANAGLSGTTITASDLITANAGLSATTITASGLITANAGLSSTTITASGLTASQSVATDASKNLVSIANTGTGNNVLATSPTLITPVLGNATGTSVSVSGNINSLTKSITGSSGGIITIQGQATAGTYNYNLPISAGSSGQVLTSGGGVSAAMTWTTPTTGTVTSVAATVPAFLSISGSPITSSGILAITLSGVALPVINGGTGSTTSTGSGSVVLANTPTLITPVLGTATGTSLNLSGLTASQSVATDASKNLVSIANTGTGNNVLATSPTLITPILGAATGTSLTLSNSSNTSSVLTNTNIDTGINSYSGFQLINSTGPCTFFLNGSGRSSDGGTSTATLRNDAGQLRFQNSSQQSTITLSDITTIFSNNVSINGTTALTNTTSSTTTATGALIVSGGVGISGNTNIGGILNTTTNTNWTYIGGNTSTSQINTHGFGFAWNLSQAGGENVMTYYTGAGTQPRLDICSWDGTTRAARLSISNLGIINIPSLTASCAVQTDSSKNLVSVVNTGTGNNVLATSPTLITPVLGNATGTSVSVSGNINSLTKSITGSTSGVITIQGQAIAGTYNYNLPTSAGTSGQVLTSQGGTTAAMIWTTPTVASGTVTSVSTTVPSFLSVSGSPITTSGTLAITLSGTALPISNGGTGSTTATGSGSVVLANTPTLITPVLGNATGTSLALTNSSNTASVFTNTNTDTGNNAYAISQLINSTGSCSLFLNGTGRSTDGGVSTATLRNDTGQLRLQNGGSTSTITLSGTTTTFSNNVSIAGTSVITNTTSSSSSTTGALVINGGVGISGNTSIGGVINIGSNNTAGILIDSNNQLVICTNNNSSSINFYNDGSQGNIRMQITNTGDVNIFSTTTSSNTASGALVVSGGVGIGGNLVISGGITARQKMQTGISNGGGSATGSVSFSISFSTSPNVVATIVNANVSNVYTVEITSVSTSSFTFIKRYQNASTGGTWNNATSENFYWIAMT